MNSAQIEKNVQKIMENFSKDSFVFDLLLAYGTPKATVTLLQKGRRNLSKEDHQVILKKKLFFHECRDEDLHITIDDLQKEKKTMSHNPRFVVVTNYKNLLAVDTKAKETLDIKIQDLAKHYAFFLPWAGIEKHRHIAENPADRKAAEKMAQLYDGILAENKIHDVSRTHDLNIFLARLLFCFFAEDTDIFENNIFTNFIGSHTQANGEDLHEQLEKLFEVLNTKYEERNSVPAHLEKFPYVNGGLFAKKHWIPKFSAKARKIIIENGELDWKDINPDIFGSMIQAVVHPGERGSLGMHYTSVPNIMKVIEPLFLNELRGEFEKYRGKNKKLDSLRQRMGKIKFFDPACGSGNFLIITYKEIRKLEMEIIEEMGAFSFSDISLDQFYGIEIDDFAHEIAKLSLYLAEHQMNVQFKDKFGQVLPTLPLKESGNIVCANATRVDWEEVCPKNEDDEIYVMGNPPYLGERYQEKTHKEDLCFVYSKYGKSKKIDYIVAWFLKGSEYIEGCENIKLAFVSTNSICQGEQVALLWLYIFEKELEISFAHTSFKWGNNAKGNAGVTVIIIGLRNISLKNKYIYTKNAEKLVKNINPYLTTGSSLFMKKRRNSLSNIPELRSGNRALDDGNFMFNENERNSILKVYVNSKSLFKQVIGASEFIKGLNRWCLWISKTNLNLALGIPEIKKRLNLIKEFRETRDVTVPYYQFIKTKMAKSHIVFVPQTSSENRDYIPIGFLDNQKVIIDPHFAIYDAEPWIFAIISSRMHMTWVRAVAGRLKTDYRYSSALCYNTFPIPTLTTKQKEEMIKYVYEILGIREQHSEKTMAQLYDPDKMPEDLRDAHHRMDLAVERIYRSKLFASDEERLEYLFGLYERMVGEEKLNLTKKK
jgi:type II restriction/modification system DNA methylase subunit YeeA